MSTSSHDDNPAAAYWHAFDSLLASTGRRAASRGGKRVAAVSDDVLVYDDPSDHLHEMVVLVALRARDVIAANARKAGERGPVAEADDLLAAARNPRPVPESPTIRSWAITIRDRAKAAIAHGMKLPFVEACRQYRLTSIEAHVLGVVVAAATRNEIVRMFRLLAGDTARPTVDGDLLRQLLSYGGARFEAAVTRALRPGSALRHFGLIRMRDDGPFAPIEIDPVLLARLLGDPAAGLTPGTSMSTATAGLERMHLHPTTRLQAETIAERLATPIATDPIVLRGGTGTGRRTLAAAFAQAQGRTLTIIDVTRLDGGCSAAGLRAELRRATLRGSWSCVVGLEQGARSLTEVQRRDLHRVMVEATGPIFVVVWPGERLGYDERWPAIDVLPLLRIHEDAVWLQALDYPLTDLGARPVLAPGILLRAAADLVGQSPTATDLAVQANQRALSLLPAGVARVQCVAWNDVAGSVSSQAALRETRRATLLIGPPGSGREYVARAIVGLAGAARVELDQLVATSEAAAYARVDQLILALEPGLFGAILLGIDDAARIGSPAVLAALAAGLRRLPGPIVGTSSGGPVGPFRSVFDTRFLLGITPADRAAVWACHLGDRAPALAAEIAEISAVPVALATVADAARLLRVGAATRLAEALSFARAGLF